MLWIEKHLEHAGTGRQPIRPSKPRINTMWTVLGTLLLMAEKNRWARHCCFALCCSDEQCPENCKGVAFFLFPKPISDLRLTHMVCPCQVRRAELTLHGRNHGSMYLYDDFVLCCRWTAHLCFTWAAHPSLHHLWWLSTWRTGTPGTPCCSVLIGWSTVCVDQLSYRG